MSGQKHLRLRYYTSWEEAMLVRLWRVHLQDIPSYTDNLPIFRDIAHGLQQQGVRLNKQEARRRINSYRNKYLSERNRAGSLRDTPSEWRLFSLIDTLFHPARPSADLRHVRNVLEEAAAKARAELPALPPLIHTSSTQVKFERDPDGSAFLDAQPQVHPFVKTEPDAYTQAQTLVLAQVKTEAKPTQAELNLAAAQYRASTESAIRRSPLTPANRQLPSTEDPSLMSHTNGQPEIERSAVKRRRGRRSILPRAGQITMAAVEELRKENKLLEEQNDACLLELEQKEKQFLAMEQSFLAYLDGQEALLAHIQHQGIKQEPNQDL